VPPAEPGRNDNATYRDHRVAELVTGGIAGVCGFAVLGSLAAVVSIPTWGFPLVLASFVGAFAVGAVTNGMILGHWLSRHAAPPRAAAA
jgi:uncharacterized membrane protein YjjB (DUF3815 family)